MDFRQVAPDIQYWLLRLSEFGSAGKDRVPPTRPWLYPFETCGFDAKIWFVLGWFRFSPHFRKQALWLWCAWQEKHPEKGNQAAAGSLRKRYGYCSGCKPLPDEVCQAQLALGDFRKTPVFPGGGRKRIGIPIIS